MSAVERGDSGMCGICLAACNHNYAPCPFCSPCEHVSGEPEHVVVGREQIPGEGPCGETTERVVCSCGRSVRSTFPWLITRWMEDHDALATT